MSRSRATRVGNSFTKVPFVL